MERVQNELTPLADPRGLFLKENEKQIKRCTVPDLSTLTEQPPPSPKPQNVNAINMSPIQETTPDKITCTVQHQVSLLKTAHQPAPTQHKSVPSTMDSKSKDMISLSPDRLFLVEEIERVTGDTWSRGHFVNLVRQTDENTIYAALSVTREKGSLESGVNLGAYFTSTLKGMTGLGNLRAKPESHSLPQQPQPDYPTQEPAGRSRPPCVHYDEPQPIDPDFLKKGWRMSYKSGGLSSLLSWVGKCMPASIDATKLWADVRETLPEMDEPLQVDRFLDTVVIRMRHADRMAEPGA